MELIILGSGSPMPSAERAGQMAARGRVKTLVLNHCVPAPAPGTEDEWIAEASAHFPGEILVAQDLLRISV